MNFDRIKIKLLRIKHRLKVHSCKNLIWLINFLPKTAGFSLFQDNINVLFWVVHIALLLYAYLVGTVVYQMYYVDGFIDAINSFFNVAIAVLIWTVSFWFVLKRNTIKHILKLSQKNDDLLVESKKFLPEYSSMIRNTKIIILICYTFHFVNDVMIFIPSRLFDMDSFSVTSCVGLEPLTQSPKREICMILLASQELTSIIVVAGYDVLILFLFSHTTATFHILTKDMNDFSRLTKNYTRSKLDAVTKRLENLIVRHSLVLETVRAMQDLFSITIGVVFVLNAISLCLFLVLPLEVCLNFGTLISYYLSVFFLYCYQGQRLTTASLKFEMAVYCCGWEYLETKEQKTVLIMLMQAQRPVMLRAVKIIPLCMYTFAGTIQNIYKLVTVFKI